MAVKRLRSSLFCRRPIDEDEDDEDEEVVSLCAAADSRRLRRRRSLSAASLAPCRISFLTSLLLSLYEL